MMIRHHQIGRCHAVGIAVDLCFGQPFWFVGKRLVQFTHLCYLPMDASSPELPFIPLPGSQEILAIRAEAIQELIVRSANCRFQGGGGRFFKLVGK